MPQVATGRTKYLQYTVHVTSLPLIKTAGDPFTGIVALVKRVDGGYYTKLSSSETYHYMDETYYSMYATIHFACICCQDSIYLNVKNPTAGYDNIQYPHTIETDDEVFFLCSEKCKNNLEMSPNLYV